MVGWWYDGLCCAAAAVVLCWLMDELIRYQSKCSEV